MKKVRIIVLLFIIFFLFDVQASSGPIKQNSIIECNGKYYGNHGNPLHWHQVESKDGKWVSISNETEIPACYIRKVNEKEKVAFSKCSDGDTARFIVNGKEMKVRFLAIDTPEVDKNELFSKEAKEYTCEALKNAKEIVLEYDSNSDREDKYGRLLAFVHVDGVLLQEKLIENGYAKVAYIYGDYLYVDDLKKIEEEAKNKKIGIWSEEALGDKNEDIQNEQEEITENNTLKVIIEIIIEIIKKLFDLLFN